MKKGGSIVLGVAIGVAVSFLVFTKWYVELTYDNDKPLLSEVSNGNEAIVNCTMPSLISSQRSRSESNVTANLDAGYNALVSGDKSKLLDFLFLLRTHPSPHEFMVHKLLSANYSEQRILLDALSLEDEKLRFSVLNGLFHESTPQAVDLALDIVKKHHFSNTAIEVEALLIEQSYQMDKSSHIADIARLLNLRSPQAYKKEEIAQHMEALLQHPWAWALL